MLFSVFILKMRELVTTGSVYLLIENSKWKKNKKKSQILNLSAISFPHTTSIMKESRASSFPYSKICLPQLWPTQDTKHSNTHPRYHKEWWPWLDQFWHAILKTATSLPDLAYTRLTNQLPWQQSASGASLAHLAHTSAVWVLFDFWAVGLKKLRHPEWFSWIVEYINISK